eukprot:TRINITY_DN9690_c0_g1_i1.p1 TRINITY_DN9690_c0_g1~~TRINITY_DN9690_c0_g1_i1.p1  ORF type:complete len:343 (+),score=29.04 TRINITY_DN9690_c0_g1_i1:132-1031(+)
MDCEVWDGKDCIPEEVNEKKRPKLKLTSSSVSTDISKSEDAATPINFDCKREEKKMEFAPIQEVLHSEEDDHIMNELGTLTRMYKDNGGIVFPRNLNLSEPKRERKTNKTLVIDLDNTLISTILDLNTLVHGPKNYLITPAMNVCFYLRPSVIHFLTKASKFYEIVIFSSGEDEYVRDVMSVIKSYCHIDHILTRKNCGLKKVQEQSKYYFVKSLSLLNRNPANVIIIDDKPSAWDPRDLENIIPVIPYIAENEGDSELYEVESLITFLQGTSDIRPFLRQFFGILEKLEKCQSSHQFF